MYDYRYSAIGVALVFGFTVGVFTGVSGPDAMVLSAVLPATLSVVVAAVYIIVEKAGSKQFKQSISGVNCLIILFSIALLSGAYLGVSYRWFSVTEASNVQKVRKEVQDLVKFCDESEQKMNNLLAKAHSEWLTIEEVCPLLVELDIDGIKPDAVKKLQRFQEIRKHVYHLQRCVEITTLVNAERDKNSLKPVSIHALCPRDADLKF